MPGTAAAEWDDSQKPLRDDVRLLGDLLGESLRAHEGTALFDLVEQVRALAKSGRAGKEADFESFRRLLAGVSISDAFTVARAFAHFLTLANIAEQHHRIRRRRFYRRTADAPPQPGSCEEGLQAIVRDGIAPQALYDAVCRLQIELVLTAHPTEITRRTLLQTQNRIAKLLAVRDHDDLTAVERDEALQALRREIATMWGTDEVRHERPTPLDEVRGSLVVFEQTVWHAIPRYLRAFDKALRETTGRGLPMDAAPIRFGSWIGGDRDGNPFVTAEVTRQACLLGRWMAAHLYLDEIEALRHELSMTAATAELREAAGGAREPYRAVLRTVRDRLEATRDAAAAALDREGDLSWPPASPDGAQGQPITSVDDLAGPLQLCFESLVAVGYGVVAEGRLADLLRRVPTFGLTLARLDVRQDAERHTEALDAITRAIGEGSYIQWPEEDRQRFLLRELDALRPLLPRSIEASEEVHDLLATMRVLAALPAESLGAYVISRVARPSDVLAVALLQKEAGVSPALRVVPLFETAESLAAAGSIMRTLLEMPAYRRLVGARQEVMFGYSDSARDLGRFSAAWALFKAQEEILAACRDHSIAVTLFHGRGGSVGRGGGPTWLAIQSQPSGSVDGTLRVTEQGEMIQAKFGIEDIALRTLEVYTTATLRKSLLDRDPSRPEWRGIMDALAGDASRAYRAIVYEDPRFPGYFEAATPIRELESLNAGSRPARRSAQGGVATLRAIPWQFAWTQTRLLLASWLGVEDALDGETGRQHRDMLPTMYREWPFFQVTADLIEMVLAKTDGRIAAQYDIQLVPQELRPLGDALRARLGRAIEAILRVTGHRELVENNPVLRRSIDVRNPYVDPINLVQIELLRRLRGGDDPETRDALIVTINGIAAGLRNTG